MAPYSNLKRPLLGLVSLLSLAGCESRFDILEECRNETGVVFEPPLPIEKTFRLTLSRDDRTTYDCVYPLTEVSPSVCDFHGGRGGIVGGTGVVNVSIVVAAAKGDSESLFLADLSPQENEVIECSGDPDRPH